MGVDTRQYDPNTQRYGKNGRQYARHSDEDNAEDDREKSCYNAEKLGHSTINRHWAYFAMEAPAMAPMSATYLAWYSAL